MKTVYASVTPDMGTEFASCRFERCDLSLLSGAHCEFVDCEIVSCTCVGMPLDGTVFDNVRFEECRLTGMDFSRVNRFLFNASFHRCALDFAVFSKNNLNGFLYSGCSIREANFIEASMKTVVFEECDLKGTLFERCNLEKADFSTSTGYFLDLELNRVKGARFSLPEAANLLMKYDIKLV